MNKSLVLLVCLLVSAVSQVQAQNSPASTPLPATLQPRREVGDRPCFDRRRSQYRAGVALNRGSDSRRQFVPLAAGQGCGLLTFAAGDRLRTQQSPKAASADGPVHWLPAATVMSCASCGCVAGHLAHKVPGV